MNVAFTWVFIAAVALATATRLWLTLRQIRHVRANRNAVPGMFADSIPLSAHQKAADYTVAKAKLGVVDTLLDALILLALTLGGALQWLSDLWQRVFALESLWHGAALILSMLVIKGALGLPLSLYRIFVIEERFGFNRMTWKLFVTDLVKGLAVGMVLGVPLLLAVLWLMLAAGTFWWLYVWLVLVVYSLFLQMIYPALVMPLFNKFSRLDDPALAGRIERLLSRTGFRSRGLFVMDGSKRSSHGNAFFAGFGAAKRIVLFDTLVSRLQPAEVEAVLAHELGHYKLRHIVKGMALSWGFSFALLLALGLIAGEPWFYEGLGMDTATLPIALALFLLVVPEFTFFVQPLLSLFSRKNEYEADRYAAANADAAQLVRALVKLYHDNSATLTPDPLHSAYYDSHPPAAMRIARLRTT
ncbi:MAG TPA: M48 family metallopeptidase [Burkholderiales bacterium]|jgi:STE24 endopeptidase|nr:M48 family metallopeptidase [Burkholderiales bacterium]HSA67988.1 M48 family metallopeptidase [Burkholderiales bacterium]